VTDEARPTYLIVEDNEAYGRSLRRIFVRWGPTTVVRSARGAEEAIRAKEWGALVIDLGLPDGSGLEVLSGLRAFRPTTPVLVLTGDSDPEAINRACELGASYAVKPASTSLLEAFIRSAASLPDRLALAASAWRQQYGLSAAEYDVLLRSALGQSRSGIAAARQSSILTVKKHCEKILKKSGERSWIDAVGRLVRDVAR
jgi:DNA-binding NarL/FixJ family response regulator